MEISQIALNQGLTFLVWTTGIILIVVAGFLVKLLIDLSALAKNLNQTSNIVNTELKPTLNELKETMKSINSIIQSTDEVLGNVKSGLETVITKTQSFSDSVFGGFLKGFMTIFSLFNRKK